jgi:tetratricopeptide repeat protein
VALPRLYLSSLPQRDCLVALEFGRVDDGQPPERWRPVSEHVAFLLDRPGGEPVGFKVTSVSSFDVEACDVAEIWDGPRFHVPLLALPSATVGETMLAAHALLGEQPTLNRHFFDDACAATGEQALGLWLGCLGSGDCMAHFALGYTLYELGRFREAYRHLRYYAEIAPASAWNWCWYGRAARAIGEVAEARAAYRRALELEAPDQPTAAARFLAELERTEEDDGAG